ncbi:MAG: Rieske (2Fe-2S) protein [Verrucomicrobiota bacterium]|nr:Rieske (2Fe-2S) protein [Verrucomicrobiota bacterium]
MQMNRRGAIKSFLLLTATSLVEGQRSVNRLLAATRTTPLLQLKLSDYPALQTINGSVRIGTSQIKSDHYPEGLFWPVIITRNAANGFDAVDAACTHEGCTVAAADPQSHRLVCPCHGSVFASDGRRLSGFAESNLLKYSTRLNGNLLSVDIPDWHVAIDQHSVITSTEKRIRLMFLGFPPIVYQVHFRPLNTQADTTVQFALSPDGPFNETEFTGNSEDTSLYVPLPQQDGFYQIAMKAMEV